MRCFNISVGLLVLFCWAYKKLVHVKLPWKLRYASEGSLNTEVLQYNFDTILMWNCSHSTKDISQDVLSSCLMFHSVTHVSVSVMEASQNITISWGWATILQNQELSNNITISRDEWQYHNIKGRVTIPQYQGMSDNITISRDEWQYHNIKGWMALSQYQGLSDNIAISRGW